MPKPWGSVPHAEEKATMSESNLSHWRELPDPSEDLRSKKIDMCRSFLDLRSSTGTTDSVLSLHLGNSHLVLEV